jgi:S-adenosyl methyltransferase
MPWFVTWLTDALRRGPVRAASRMSSTHRPACTTTIQMYDYLLGGNDNYSVDRKAAEAVRQLRPNVAE